MSELQLSLKESNSNYAATVVELKDFVDLPSCDNVKAASIFGYSVIISKDTQVGEIGLFFPAETKLSHEFLSNNNLYRKPEYGNVDETKTGFFEQHGRVRTMKFRGHKSEGFYIPLNSLAYTFKNDEKVLNPFGPASFLVSDNELIGTVFDHIGDHEICRKYVPKTNPAGLSSNQAKSLSPKLVDSIVDGQFAFHTDTENLRRNFDKIRSDHYISITDKWHGTSVVIGKLAVKKEITWKDKLASWFGISVQDFTYGLVYSSRKVIKAVNGVQKNGDIGHYYSEDIWGQVAKEVESRIPNGFTIYGEIVGYTSDGAQIQKGYSYGCEPGTHRLVIYRVTLTTLDGTVIELSWPQLENFCAKYGFETVPVLFYGKAQDLFEDIQPWKDVVEDWQEMFIKSFSAQYANDGDCPYNTKGTPAEGVCVRIDHLESAETYKLKNFKFLAAESKLLDKGEADLETIESTESFVEENEVVTLAN